MSSVSAEQPGRRLPIRSRMAELASFGTGRERRIVGYRWGKGEQGMIRRGGPRNATARGRGRLYTITVSFGIHLECRWSDLRARRRSSAEEMKRSVSDERLPFCRPREADINNIACCMNAPAVWPSLRQVIWHVSCLDCGACAWRGQLLSKPSVVQQRGWKLGKAGGSPHRRFSATEGIKSSCRIQTATAGQQSRPEQATAADCADSSREQANHCQQCTIIIRKACAATSEAS